MINIRRLSVIGVVAGTLLAAESAQAQQPTRPPSGQVTFRVACSKKGVASICDKPVSVKASFTDPTAAGGLGLSYFFVHHFPAGTSATQMASTFAQSFQGAGANARYFGGSTILFPKCTFVDWGLNAEAQQVKVSGNVGMKSDQPSVKEIMVKDCPLLGPEEARAGAADSGAQGSTAVAPPTGAGTGGPGGPLVTTGGTAIFTLTLRIPGSTSENGTGLEVARHLDIVVGFEAANRASRVVDRISDALVEAGVAFIRQDDERILILAGPAGERIDDIVMDLAYTDDQKLSLLQNTLEWDIGSTE